MPTRKQRRRRQKDRRHDWEEVYVDENGREIPADEAAALADSGRTSTNGTKPSPARSGARPQRTVDPPSWTRVAKRGLIFAPFMFIVISVLDANTSLVARVLYTLQLMLLFVPFSYMVDTFAYRMHRKRAGAAAGTPARR